LWFIGFCDTFDHGLLIYCLLLLLVLGLAALTQEEKQACLDVCALIESVNIRIAASECECGTALRLGFRCELGHVTSLSIQFFGGSILSEIGLLSFLDSLNIHSLF
jgi:hypothetical protein